MSIVLRTGEQLTKGQSVKSADGMELVYQGDGNLVVYTRAGRAVWASQTSGTSAGFVVLQGDGNLVIYDEQTVPIWASNSFTPGAVLELSRAGMSLLALSASWRAEDFSTGQGGGEPTPTPSGHADPWVGRFRIEQRAFVDNNGPKLPVFLHAGDLIGQGLTLGLPAILPALDRAAELGYHGLRSWFQLHLTTGTWVPGPTQNGWNPLDDRKLFVEILAAGAERKLLWNLSGGGIKGLSNSAENELFDLVADAMDQVGPIHFAQIQAANEVRDTGDRDDLEPDELLRLLERVRRRHPDTLYSTSAFTGIEDAALTARFTPPYAQHSVVHGYRGGRAHDKIRHIFSWMRENGAGRPLAWQDEPFGVPPGVSAQENSGELDAHVMQLAACMSAMSRQAWTYFCGSGVVYRGWDGWAGLEETPAIVRQLPQDLMRFRQLSHSGPSQRGVRIHSVRDDAPEVRGDYAIHDDGRVVEIVYGPPGQRRDLPTERQTTVDKQVLSGAWGSVVVQRLI
jgi:hypothetical protein